MLPGPLSGCALRLLDVELADAAHATAHVALQDKVQAIAERLGHPISGVADSDQAAAARSQLAREGTWVSMDGGVEHTPDAADEWGSSSWAVDIADVVIAPPPEEHTPQQARARFSVSDAFGSLLAAKGPERLPGRAWRLLDASWAVRQLAEMPVAKQLVMLDSGGRGTGSLWSAASAPSMAEAPPFFDSVHLSSPQARASAP